MDTGSQSAFRDWFLATAAIPPELFLRVAARIVLSVVLGCASVECLYIVDKLKPYSPVRDWVTDVLTFPGFIMAHFFQLVNILGVSDDSWWAFFLGNSFFYAVLCYFILNVLHLPPRVPRIVTVGKSQ